MNLFSNFRGIFGRLRTRAQTRKLPRLSAEDKLREKLAADVAAWEDGTPKPEGTQEYSEREL